jgi:hypothetical protein
MELQHFASASILLILYSTAAFGFPASFFHGSSLLRVKLQSKKCFQKSCFTAPYVTDHALHYRVKADDINDLLLNARECAYSSSCSLEEAQEYLEAVSALQSRGFTKRHRSSSAFKEPFPLSYVMQQLKKKIDSSVS